MPEGTADADSAREQQTEPESAEDATDTERQAAESHPVVPAADPDGMELVDGNGSQEFSITTQMIRDQPPQFVATSYDGPLPPPAMLKGYDEVSPGAATKIIDWVTSETEHRRQLEVTESKHRRKMEIAESEHRMRLETRAMDLGEKAMNAGIARAKVGMILAWPLVMGIVAVGAYLIGEGHDWAGTVLVETALVLVIGSYVLNRFARPKGDRTSEAAPEEGEKE